MRVAIFGGTGRTGRPLVEQALAAGHEVSALARDPARLAARHERLRPVRGDLLDPTSVAATLDGADAAVFVAGPPGRGPCTLYSEGGGNVVKAMEPAGARRLLAMTASAVEFEANDTRLLRLAKPVLMRLFRETYADMLRMEAMVRQTDLDWTIVRPPQLTNRSHTGRYRVSYAGGVRRGLRIPRADLAAALLALLTDPRAVHATVGVAT